MSCSTEYCAHPHRGKLLNDGIKTVLAHERIGFNEDVRCFADHTIACAHCSVLCRWFSMFRLLPINLRSVVTKDPACVAGVTLWRRFTVSGFQHQAQHILDVSSQSIVAGAVATHEMREIACCLCFLTLFSSRAGEHSIGSAVRPFY